MISATASGCTTGGTGRGFRGIRVRAQSNCGVFTAGNSTMVTATAPLSRPMPADAPVRDGGLMQIAQCPVHDLRANNLLRASHPRF
jgi:hypothetical protein